jgi:flagellar hook protein FlgE
MGIFGALTTAVSGLRAQSYALENISGNIANSQTTAFKRTDTSFTDLIPDALPKRQVSGAVISQSRATNSVQGDIQSASNDTYMALNGEGYFVVAQPSGSADGQPIFSGTDLYTRRGDFEIDKDGFLVNGAGYYLKLLPIDRATGNVSGSVPEVIPLTNDILPARATGVITYRGNLPKNPTSGMLKPTDFATDPRPTGSPMPIVEPGIAMTTPADLTDTDVVDGHVLTLQATGGAAVNFTISATAAPGNYNTLADLVEAINDSDELNGVTASIVGGNQIVLTGDNPNVALTVSGNGAGELGLATPTFPAPVSGVGGGTVSAADAEEFEKQSIAGDAITVYDETGTPVNVSLRWAKVNSADSGGVDTWNLFYKSDSSVDASGSDPVWTNIGTNFTFVDGKLSPPTASTEVPNLTVDGVSLGDVTISHGSAGLTSFNDANANRANILTLNQDGYATGETVRVQIGEGGRITAFYSNGQMADIAEIPTVFFNADNMLKRLDGGAFATTYESGPPIPGAPGSIIGQSLEGSNTDIADEFTKLIVTQQAYSANTRIVSTADEMLQEALNMIR